MTSCISVVIVDGDLPDQVEKYLKEIEEWEVRLAESNHSEFWSVET